MRTAPLLLLALACASDPKSTDVTGTGTGTTTRPTGTTTTPPTGTHTTPPTGDARVDEVQNAWPHIVTVARVPTTADPVAVLCEAGADEALLWDFPSGDGDLDLIGLLGDTPYDCTLLDTGSGTTTAFTVEAGSGDAPTASVDTHPSLVPSPQPFTLLNTNDQCGTNLVPTLRIYDLDGRSRWAHQLRFDVNLATEQRYHGDGLVVWGGGYATDYALQWLQLDHTALDTVGHELAPDATMFHHDSKVLDDGTELVLAETYNTDGATTWLGWRVIGTGGSWTGSLDSQVLFDAGLLPAGGPGEDAYHANWTDLVDGTLYVNQCFTDELLALDPTTGDLQWRLGPGSPSLDYRDADGSPLPDSELPICAHGHEVIGDRVLIHDNGRYGERDFSRAMEVVVDPVAGTATRTWVYTEPDWFENAMGDIDDLGDGRVLIHMAHVECWGLFSDLTNVVELDTDTQEVVWRMAFDDSDVASYRAERIDACDALPHLGYCPGLADRRAALGL